MKGDWIDYTLITVAAGGMALALVAITVLIIAAVKNS